MSIRPPLEREMITGPAIQRASRVERRRGPRWGTDKSLQWRLHRGRRPRHARVLERALHGIVFLPEPDDHGLPPLGTVVHPANEREARRHGFRTGIVRRYKPDLSQRSTRSLAVIEILS